ncbi:glutathione S-transferase [Aquisalinus flavus]|uniref:Glutathione S-transferase n=1 Tax=Aquisalinus flavus TaxID=1526572 RepID=A0A8J2V2E3_9PROT|nr:glutathione S-transferase [Aquisalinus flavus]MBD0428121.1 glutathione S-transferase [Aquisalinus flavus]GGD18514.1 glutathione S-transferase [Aquisalinus flavus]
MTSRPVLYSFRRCPYAMRARLALSVSGLMVELREVVLRDKPPAMLEASPKGTVPVLVAGDRVIEESDEIMFWALRQSDPENWLQPWRENRPAVEALIVENDGPFKRHLDRYKYPVRYPEENIVAEEQRDAALEILAGWDSLIGRGGWLFGEEVSVADMALLPFVRQYAHVDKDWFDARPIPGVKAWLERFLASDRFRAIMQKFDQWQEGTKGVTFPP